MELLVSFAFSQFLYLSHLLHSDLSVSGAVLCGNYIQLNALIFKSCVTGIG